MRRWVRADAWHSRAAIPSPGRGPRRHRAAGFEDEVVGPVEAWFQDLEVDGDLVRYEIHYHIARSGEELVSHVELKFRTRAELGRTLSDAGFSVESVFGDWDGRPAHAASRELIFVVAT